MLSQAIFEFTNKDVNHSILDYLINLILVYTLDAFKLDKLDATNLDVTSKEEILCYKVMNYIDTHIFEIKSLSEVSNYLNYNYSYLTNLFKKTTNMTIIDYYNNKRFEIAKLLINEWLNIIYQLN
jgi:YesN/AraC family two-component response regulator